MKTSIRIFQLIFSILFVVACFMKELDAAGILATFLVLYSVWYNEELLKEIRRNQ